MIKMLALLKRKPGMSTEEFRAYYETYHARLGEKYLRCARRYVRRYVVPERNTLTEKVEPTEFDVILEIWWDSREGLETDMATIGGEAREIILKDEANFLDGHAHRVFTVDEMDSVLPQCPDQRWP